jgi:hypothetical protein
MAIFHQINYSEKGKLEKISIKHLDTAYDHFGDKEKIISFLQDLRSSYYFSLRHYQGATKEEIQEAIDLEISQIVHNYLKPFPRITKVEFYRETKKNHLIVIVVSDIPKFHKVPLMKRKMMIEEKNDFKFHLIEILKPEAHKLEKDLPKHWKLDQPMTAQYNRRKIVFND